MLNTLLPNYTVEKLDEYHKTSTPCSLILANSENWLALGYELDTHLIVFSPVMIDGYIDDDSTYQYFLRKVNYTSNDNIIVLPKANILYVNNMGNEFKSAYLDYQTARLKYMSSEGNDECTDDKETVKNVVPISKKLH
jgi:hypothetical protein